MVFLTGKLEAVTPQWVVIEKSKKRYHIPTHAILFLKSDVK